MKRTLLVVIAVIATSFTVLPSQANRAMTFRGYLPVAVGTANETQLSYGVTLPDANTWGPGPYPTVMFYDGYETSIYIYDETDRFLDNGYAIVGVSMRGTSCSGGTFDYFEPLQAQDGYDAIEWMATQPWTNGDIALAGKSYPGISQMFVARLHPPHLRAIIPGHIFADLYRDVPYPGGILNATFAGWWTIAQNYYTNINAPVWAAQNNDQQCILNQRDHALNPPMNPLPQVVASHPFDDAVYRERSPWYFADQIDVPTFLIGSWQDEQVGSRSAEVFTRLRPEVPKRFMFTNGDHEEYFGPDVNAQEFRFLSYYLRRAVPTADQIPGESFEDALARYEAEDQVIIKWENGATAPRLGSWTSTFSAWPPAETDVWRLNLRPDGSLDETPYAWEPPSNKLDAADARAAGGVDYAYTPGIGSQARGGFALRNEVSQTRASWNDRPAEGTSAAFETSALSTDHELVGTASVDLTIASSAPDTDLQVTLSEIRPDGMEMFVQQGWLRASHRREDASESTVLRPFQTHAVGDVAPLVPGQPTKARVEIFPFAHTFRAGSRLRISIEAPHIQPDLWGFALIPTPAVNTIFTSYFYPSSIALPLIGGATAGAPLPPCTLRNQPCRTYQG